MLIKRIGAGFLLALAIWLLTRNLFMASVGFFAVAGRALGRAYWSSLDKKTDA
jgi:hypothetical protein